MNEILELTERLKAIRKALNLNQRDFAEKLDISCTSVSELEKGKYKPNFEYIQKCVKKFRINIFYLMFGEGDMFLGDKPLFGSNRYAARVEDVQEFLYNFERSPLLQYHVLSDFSGFYRIEKDIIDLQVVEYEKKYN